MPWVFLIRADGGPVRSLEALLAFSLAGLRATGKTQSFGYSLGFEMWYAPDSNESREYGAGYYGDINYASGYGVTGTGRFFYGQPTVYPERLPEEEGQPLRWRFPMSASGICLFGFDDFSPITIVLPGGIVVEYGPEPVSEDKKLNLFSNYAHWIDKCLALRIKRDGVVVSEGFWQHRTPGEHARLSAGLFWSETESRFRVYAHLGEMSNNKYNHNRVWSVEESPLIGEFWPDRYIYGVLASPYGRGVSLLADADEQHQQGIIEVTAQDDFPDYRLLPSASWFVHDSPLEGEMELIPSSVPIADREEDGIGVGRHRSAVAISPLGMRYGALESGGHPEWRGVPYHDGTNFAGASAAFNGGRFQAVTPPKWEGTNYEWARTNVHPDPIIAGRLTKIRASWVSPFGWTTGNRDLVLNLGAYNEYRTDTWQSHSGNFDPGGFYGGSQDLVQAFIAVNILRVDLTNLGAAESISDAVEITRYVVRWFAAAKAVRPNSYSGGTLLWIAENEVVLPASEGEALLAGNPVTITGYYPGPLYLQGTYPVQFPVSVYGSFTIQAIGP